MNKNKISNGLTELSITELHSIEGGARPPWWYSPALVIYDAFTGGWDLGEWIANETCSHESCQ